jgi:acetyl esterase/lipase
MAMVYMGLGSRMNEMLPILETNEHVLLLDEGTRNLYTNLMDLYSIPNDLQIKDLFVREFDEKKINVMTTQLKSLNESGILARDKEVRYKVMQLFNEEVSPILTKEATLRAFPSTYMAICDHDTLRDEQMIFLERLRKLRVRVTFNTFKCGHSTQEADDHMAKNLDFWPFFEKELGICCF